MNSWICGRRRLARSIIVTRTGVAVLLVISFVGVSVSYAQINAQLDKVDASDAVQIPPPNIVCVDLLVIPSANYGWLGTGIRAQTYNGARFVYSVDPNSGQVTGVAPGPEDRFVTFFSEPRARDSDVRYGLGAAPIIAGSYCTGATARFNDSALDVSAGLLPPLQLGSGWVLRVALDLSEVNDPRFRIDSPDIVVSNEQPPNSIVLLDSYCGGQELNRGTTIGDGITSAYFDWGIYGIIPEPGTSLLLVVVLVGLRVAGHRAC